MEPFYNIPKEVIDDIQLYKIEVERFNRGETTAAKLRPYRVARGIYAQRGQERFMTRIKVPGGNLTPEQMIRVADLSEKYGNGIPHVTTRQDIQLHYVKLDDTVKAMQELTEVGLTTRGGGGNTVRNVTACYDSGVCEKEVFNVAPFAPAMTEFFLTHPKGYNLPRKFKIAFSGCSDDCSFSTINDVGFIAKTKEIDGVEQRGFRVYAAGGMGAKSRVAEMLEDFVPVHEAVYVAEAIMLIFDEHGNRKNKHKARLRYVMEKIGREEFLKLYREKMDFVKSEGEKRIDVRTPIYPNQNLGDDEKALPTVDDADFNTWMETNVSAQKHDGFYYAKLRLPLGDIKAEALRMLAETVKKYGEGCVCATHDQNMMVRWLKGCDLYSFYQDLVKIGIAKSGVGGPSDITACPGASTCNLGICLSRNMTTALSKELESNGLPITTMEDVKIKVSGCQNSCGQHPIGPIGLQGGAKRGDGRMAPHYNILLGGRVEEGHTALGRELGYVPAKKIPEVISRFLKEFADSREEGEDYYAYLERKGYERMGELIKEYPLPSYEKDPDAYKDWGADEEFSLAGLGEGECGAGVLDMIEADIDDGRRHIYKAENDLAQGKLDDASETLFKALGLTAKSLLVTKGIEPIDDYISVTEFEKNFIGKGLLDKRFSGLVKRWAKYLSGLLTAEGLKDEIYFMEDLSKNVADLYAGMDANMKFKGEKEKEVKTVPAAEEKKEEEPAKGETDVSMDLRGVKCPINYVKAKIRLEMMSVGQTLQILLDDGEPIRNVPNSLKNDGQEIVKMEQVGEYFDLVVKKAA
ncbi:MAG: sulfurtransferase TusA family protein [Deltaproteobacteria bacterium]|nr:sulfurtransferase TusA family protein [Deltaproteobacteria bacterium]